MKQLLISVHDIKADTWYPISQVRNLDVAMRDFCAAVNKPANMLHDYPDDFELWIIAELDCTGMPTVSDTHSRRICSAREVVHE